jgi:hypothetical protein
MTETDWETGRMMKNKLHRLREDPLIRSIGPKMSRWRYLNLPAGGLDVSSSSDSGPFPPLRGEKRRTGRII